MPTFLDLDLLDSKVNLAYADYVVTPFLLVFALTKRVVGMKPLPAEIVKFIERHETEINLIRLKLTNLEIR